MPERHGVETLLYFGFIALFALFGASARVFYRWETQTRFGLQLVGNLMVSMFSALLVGFLLWDAMAERPMALLALTGLAAWGGGDVIDRLALRLVGYLRVEDKRVEDALQRKLPDGGARP